MKTYFTSNYERDGKNPHAVAISHPSMVPADYTGARNETLAPTEDLLHAYHNQHISHDAYKARYIELLTSRGISPESILLAFPADTVFICFDYEDDDPSVCHRLILGEWLVESGLARVFEKGDLQDEMLDHAVEDTFPASDPAPAPHIS